jgi:hypothetical protein
MNAEKKKEECNLSMTGFKQCPNLFSQRSSATPAFEVFGLNLKPAMLIMAWQTNFTNSR